MGNGDRKRSKRIRKGLLVLLMSAFCTTAAWGASSEQQVYTFLTDNMQLKPAAACGIMANIALESGFNPGITGPGGSYGLCQWLGPRKSNLFSWCSSNGYNASSISGQMHFLRHELQTVFPNVLRMMQNVSNTASGAYSAGYNWCYYFEIPADRSRTAAYRASRARNYYWPNYGANALYLTAAASGRGIRLSWPAQKSGKIQIYRSKKSGKNFTLLDTVSAKTSSYVDKTAVNEKTYYYKVTLVTSSGKRSSNQASMTIDRKLKASNTKITLSETSYTYTGEAICPKVTVKHNGTKLKKDADYTVTYKNNVKVGTATVWIKGTGQFSGRLKATYKISKARQKLQVANLTVAYTTSKLKLETGAAGKIKTKTTDPKVAKGTTGGLYLKGCGQTKVTVMASATKEFLAAKKTFTLTVKPATPKVLRVARTPKGNIGVRIQVAGKGYIEYVLQTAADEAFTQNVQTIRQPVKKGDSFYVSNWKAGENRYLRVKAVGKIGKKKMAGDWSETMAYQPAA